MQKKVSFDTMAIVDAVQSRESLQYLGRFGVRHYKLIISTRVEGEAINRLQKPPYNYSEEQAKEEVRKVISYLNLSRESKEKNDDEMGDKLIEKYGYIGCHYPDSTIIAHMKRIGVNIVISRDKNFKKVAEREGLKVHHIPTEDAIIGRRVRELFRGHH
jgi:predicted nucleic acid-binding protein